MIRNYNGLALILCAGLFVLSSCSGPKALFETQSSDVKAGEWLEFSNVSKDGIEYTWDFGDGNTSNEVSPKHRYWESGRYEVSLTAKNEGKSSTTKSELVVTAPEKCLVLLETTFGSMVLELYDDTPFHRDNFVKHAEGKFYDGLLFHRVMANFMIQGGDPQSRHSKPNQPLGRGTPGYTLPAEFRENHVHLKGALAAARVPDAANPEKASSGSQFYIVHGKRVNARHLQLLQESRGISYSEEQIADFLRLGGAPHLDGEYTVYGQVIEGFDVIDKIATVSVDRRNRPKEDLSMTVRLIK